MIERQIQKQRQREAERVNKLLLDQDGVKLACEREGNTKMYRGRKRGKEKGGVAKGGILKEKINFNFVFTNHATPFSC